MTAADAILVVFVAVWRDRFQIDLIDFRKLRKRDPFGVLMRWVMTIKDHTTGLTYLCALPRKHPHLIPYKLQEIIGIIGYPKIFHTDNGKEFTAKVVLKALREMNPHIYAVTGHPRCPSDQGSVESMNKLVKRILGTLLTERRLAGDNPNWTEVLGMVSATINSQHGRGKDDVSSFEAVYGQVLNHDMSCSKAEARECWTLPQFLKVTNDEEFAEYAAKNYILDEDSSDADEQEDSSGYFSDEELQDNEKEEVTDDDFFNLLNQNILETDSARKQSPEEEHLADDDDHYQTFDVDEDHDTYLSLEKKQFKSDEVHSPDVIPLTQFLTKPPTPKQTVDDEDDEEEAVDVWDESWVRDATVAERQKSTLPPGGRLSSIAEEWERQRQLDRTLDNANSLWCRLYCDHCRRGGTSSAIRIPNSQLEHRLRFSSDWYDDGFIYGFAALLQHDAHISIPNYKSSDRIMMVTTAYPNEQVKEIRPYGSAKKLARKQVYMESNHNVERKPLKPLQFVLPMKRLCYPFPLQLKEYQG